MLYFCDSFPKPIATDPSILATWHCKLSLSSERAMNALMKGASCTVLYFTNSNSSRTANKLVNPILQGGPRWRVVTHRMFQVMSWFAFLANFDWFLFPFFILKCHSKHLNVIRAQSKLVRIWHGKCQEFSPRTTDHNHFIFDAKDTNQSVTDIATSVT